MTKQNIKEGEMTLNQKKVLQALMNLENYKPSMKLIKKETGLVHNKSVTRAYKGLQKKGFIDSKKRVLSSELLCLEVDGTTTQGELLALLKNNNK